MNVLEIRAPTRAKPRAKNGDGERLDHSKDNSTRIRRQRLPKAIRSTGNKSSKPHALAEEEGSFLIEISANCRRATLDRLRENLLTHSYGSKQSFTVERRRNRDFTVLWGPPARIRVRLLFGLSVTLRMRASVLSGEIRRS